MIIELIKNILRINSQLYSSIRNLYRYLMGYEEHKWCRIVMDFQTRQWIKELHPEKLKVLEISGTSWSKNGFKEYLAVQYPAYDVCEKKMDMSFDLIIAEQVFEHILWPYKAGKNVYAMLNNGGYFLINTPFLIKIHNEPNDCTRWTEQGIKYFLAECGFPLGEIKTGSWGNRKCINADFHHWHNYSRRIHSLKNEPEYPMVVWALARKIDSI